MIRYYIDKDDSECIIAIIRKQDKRFTKGIRYDLYLLDVDSVDYWLKHYKMFSNLTIAKYCVSHIKKRHAPRGRVHILNKHAGTTIRFFRQISKNELMIHLTYQ